MNRLYNGNYTLITIGNCLQLRVPPNRSRRIGPAESVPPNRSRRIQWKLNGEIYMLASQNFILNV